MACSARALEASNAADCALAAGLAIRGAAAEVADSKVLLFTIGAAVGRGGDDAAERSPLPSVPLSVDPLPESVGSVPKILLLQVVRSCLPKSSDVGGLELPCNVRTNIGNEKTVLLDDGKTAPTRIMYRSFGTSDLRTTLREMNILLSTSCVCVCGGGGGSRIPGL